MCLQAKSCAMGLIKIKRKLNADAAPAQAGAPAASGLLPAAAAPVQPAVACAAPQLPTAPVLTDTGAPPAKKVKILKIKSKARHAVPAVLGQPPTATPTPVFPRAPVQPAQNHSQQRPAPSRKPLSKRPLPTAVPVAGGHTVKQASGTGVEPLKKKIKLKLGTKPVKGSLNGEKKVRPLAMPPPAMISAAATIQPPLLATPQKSPVKFRILKPKIKIKTPSALNSNLSPAPAAAMKPVIKPLPQMGTPMGMKVKRKPKLEPKIQQGAQVIHYGTFECAASACFSRSVYMPACLRKSHCSASLIILRHLCRRASRLRLPALSQQSSQLPLPHQLKQSLSKKVQRSMTLSLQRCLRKQWC